MLRFVHAKRVLLPLAVSVTPILATAAGCDWVDQVDHVRVNVDGGEDAATGVPTARFKLAEGATTAPDFLDVPFPSDVYLSNGRIGRLPGLEKVVTGAGNAFIANDIAANNGFSRVALAMFYVDDGTGAAGAVDIDVASLPSSEADCIADTSSVFLIDLQAGTRVACRAQFHNNRRTGSRSNLAVGPARGIVLEEGHQYAAVLTNRVKTAAGIKLAASTDFDRIRKGDRAGAASLYGAALDKVNTAIGAALAGDQAEIVSLAPFTTNAMTDELFKLREALPVEVPELKWDSASLAPMTAAKFQTPSDGVLHDGFAALISKYLGVPPPPTHLPGGRHNPSVLLPVRAYDNIGVIGTAAFKATSFLQSKDNYTTVGHATFPRKENGELTLTPNETSPTIWVTFTVPLITTAKPMPADGFPAVILQHGLSGSRDYIFALANTLAGQGYVTVAIDSITFGARAARTDFQKDVKTDYFGRQNNNAEYKNGDGIADLLGDDPRTAARNGPSDLFGGLINIGALRDQMRQAALDTSQLVRILQTRPELKELQNTPDTTVPKIDPQKIAYIGNSLGGIQGAVAAAIEPNIKHWVLNVAGGGLLTELGSHSPRISALLKQAGAGRFGFESDTEVFNESHPLITLLQTIADPGDPLNYANLLVKQPRSVNGTAIPPRNILQIEVLYDEVVPNEANEALARAGGWNLAAPNVGSNAGIVDVKDMTKNRERIPFASVEPADADGIHDTPQTGVTAVMVQVSPSQHGWNLDSHVTKRLFAIPLGRFDQLDPFPAIPGASADTFKTFPTSYMQLQGTVVNFIGTGFAGQVPRVKGFVAPVRDSDGDGASDADDADPNNPDAK